MGQKRGNDCCKPTRPGFQLPATLAGLNLAAGLATGSMPLLAGGVLSEVDLGVIYIILSAGDARANLSKIVPACLVAAAFGAGSAIMVAAAAGLAGSLPVKTGWASPVLAALLTAGTGAACRLFSSRRKEPGNLQRALLTRSCRFSFFRLLLVSSGILLSRVWHPAAGLLVAQALGIAIMQLGLEANRAGLENPFNLYRGSRLRQVVEESVRKAAGRVRVGRIEMEGRPADLHITVALDENLNLQNRQRIVENIRDQLARNFNEINRLQVAAAPVQDMV